MFNSHTVIEKLNPEVLINITSYLDIASLLQFSLTAKAFRHLISDELVFRRLVERDYHVKDKKPEETWVDIYKQNKLNLNGEIAVSEQATTIDTMNTTTTTIQEDVIDTTVQQTEQEHTKDEPMMNHTPKQQEEIIEKDDDQTTTTTTTTTASQNKAVSNECPHLEKVSDSINEIKRIIYKIEKPSLCDLCLSKTSSYLNMSDSCHIEACRSCLETDIDDEEHFPVQLELSTGDLYCFKCKDENGSSPILLDQFEKAKKIIEYLKTPTSEDDLDKRRKAEQQLYVQELRREDMSLKHYLVEKQWGRTWMLFRTREGSPLPGKITNQKLARLNGTLDPNIRLPMDKYRPSPETHGDIVSERLWSYLVKAYGVQGRAYSEDDIIAPEYARLRVYVDDYKKSIHLYP